MKQSKLLKIKSKILSNLSNKRYKLKLGSLIIQLGLKGFVDGCVSKKGFLPYFLHSCVFAM